MCQVELPDIVSGCRGVYVEETCAKNNAQIVLPGCPLLESRTLWQCTFFTVFQHYKRSFVKVNEDVLMATREKILLEEVSTLP